MQKLLHHFFEQLQPNKKKNQGQGLTEYALILGLVALAVIAIVQLLGPAIEDTFSRLAGRAPLAPPSLLAYTPPPTSTIIPTVNPAFSPTPTATATPEVIPPTSTPTQTATPTATATPVCVGYGPYDLPGRVQMESFTCGGSNAAFVDSTGDGGPGSGAYRQDVTSVGPDLATVSGGYYLGWLVPNEWVIYDVDVLNPQLYDFSFRAAANNGNGRFHFEILKNGQTAYTSSSIVVPNTGGSQSWSDINVLSIPMLGGVNKVKVIFDTGGFNLNYFDVTASALPTATPEPAQCFTLTFNVSPSNSGSVGANPQPNCANNKYVDGTVVTLSNSANNSYVFSNWSGDATGTNSTAAVTMNSDKSVTANYSQVCYTVTTAVSPNNSGTVTKSPAPNCNNGSQYVMGTQVTFGANPANNYTFVNWSGNASGTNSTTSIVINSPTTVTANFVEDVIITIVSEDFENGWNSGTGWLSGWTTDQEAEIVSSGTPYAGSRHLRLADNGVAERGADLSGYTNATLTFYWKSTDLASNEAFYVDISANGGSNWTTIHTVTIANDDSPYAEYEISLSGGFLTNNFKIQFYGINPNDWNDYFYVDNITITGN